MPVDLYLTFFLRFLYENSGTKKEQTTQGIRFLYYNNILLINTITWTENPCVPGSNPGLGTSKFEGLQPNGCDPFFFMLFLVQLLSNFFGES